MSDLTVLNQLATNKDKYTSQPKIICADGESISVQASEYAYCIPRETGAASYTHVEVGYPSVQPNDNMMKYCEDCDRPTDTVYAYVPIEVVLEYIYEHGGLHPDYST